MDPIVLSEDTGFVAVVLGDVEKSVDLYDVYNRLVEIQQEHGENVRPRNAATKAFMAELGFGDVSTAAAIAFTNAIYARMGALEKKDGSAASPEPTHG